MKAGVAAPMALGITVLTSDTTAASEEVERRMGIGRDGGCGGFVCAGAEVATAARVAPGLITYIPGIRLAGAVLEAGADAVTLINTVMGLALDPATGAARLGNGGGGLSGAAIHPVAVRAVYEVRAAFPFSAIVGVGGVASGESAAELLAAGANAVQVGTATFADPRAPERVLHELRAWCAKHKISHLDDLVGRAHR